MKWQITFKDVLNQSVPDMAGEYVKDKSGLFESKLQRIWQYVGDAPGWLARVVRPIANLNFVLHTVGILSMRT
jgi:hypothetical protein